MMNAFEPLMLLASLHDPHHQGGLVQQKTLKIISHIEKTLGLRWRPGYFLNEQHELRTDLPQLAAALLAEAGYHLNTFDIETGVSTHAIRPGIALLPGVKNVIAVASGKGGVGKSTTAVNLALSLLAEGAAVGLVDADIYGPSVPTMLGLRGKPESLDGKMMEPLRAHGLQANSMGFLLEQEDAPAIWRGPMVSQALEQLCRQTRWQDLDYLIVDMPPGTGDIALSLTQKMPVSGAVIVTTPQDLALVDARKALRMFQKVSVPVLGVIENMALHQCSACGHTEAIFGEGGGEQMAAQYGLPYLGGLPLDISIRAQTDSGTPTVAAEPDGKLANVYRQIALRLAAQLALQPLDYSGRFPIRVEDKSA